MNELDREALTLPAQTVLPVESAPVRVIKSDTLKALGQSLKEAFERYAKDRYELEQKWLRNMRQYLGIYDPEIERLLGKDRSRAYPRITRVKCISVLSRIMNLMFPGNERNWELKASPSADMSPDDVKEAIEKLRAANEAAGVQSNMPPDEIDMAVQELANERAVKLSRMIDDQLQELGGDQTLDYVALSRKVAQSGIMYGLGVLTGPYVKVGKKAKWTLNAQGEPEVTETESYKPSYEFLPVWDFYPDLSAKNLFTAMDGYFVRRVLSRTQLRALGEREDFLKASIDLVINTHKDGNYKSLAFETELRDLATSKNAMEVNPQTGKYEIVIWHGPVSGHQLSEVGADVSKDNMTKDIEAEVWLCDGIVIKADINPWRKLGLKMRSVHPFMFDEDDTGPIGNGLPNIVRDSQMSVAAATRMLLDNASVVCGPNIEVNTELLRADMDVTSIHAYKIWYREGTNADAQVPAVRNVNFDSHMDELLKTIDLFMRFADAETFVGPATGGDMAKTPSEPMRTAAGASMLRGDAALPFKDIVRNFDTFTQSLILSLVMFNRKFNPEDAKAGDYDVIARGATSLIAKEVRGMQLDVLAQTLTPEDAIYIDRAKLMKARLAVRDVDDIMATEAEIKRRQEANAQQQQQQQQTLEQQVQAEIRKTLSDAFKNIAQAQKNMAGAEAAAVNTALGLLEQGLDDGNEARAGSGSKKPARAA